jgi:hypothetical protein
MTLFSKSARRDRRRVQKRSRVDLHFDSFEERLLLSTYTVNDAGDGNSGSGNNGTLRFVLNRLAVTGTGSNEIDFNIAASGVQTITLGSDLPAISKQVTIRGYTEPGSAVNTASVGTNAVLTVQLNLNGHAGLVFNSGAAGSRVGGLAIFGGSGAGIAVNDDNVAVAGTFLGIQANGATTVANASGVAVASGVTGAHIGSAAAADLNLISGNTTAGISIAGTALVEGNLIGTDRTSVLARPNAIGVGINAGKNSTIGGTAPGDANTIANNTSAGVSISGAAASGNEVLGNSIYANAQGIVLSGGANGGQPSPTNLGVTSVTGLTIITGQLTSAAAGSYRVEFFVSAPGDPIAVEGQAHIFIGSTTVTFAGAGTQTFNATFNATLPAGQVITATATSSTTNNTSRFSTHAGLSSPFVVTTTADSGENTNPTFGSLRAAILSGNANAGSDTISFNVPQTDPGFNHATGFWTIQPPASLPTITDTVLLDATTQPGYLGSPVVQINGNGLAGDGLVLGAGGGTNSSNSRIRGLSVFAFGGAGIHVQTSGAVIQSDILGTNAGGTATGLGNQIGVWIDNIGGATIGGQAAVGNLISGNTSAGVSISGTSATTNVVQGNRIGTDASGTAALGNNNGIVIDGGSSNSIGAASSSLGNTIAFNSANGVLVENNGVGNAIRANSIFHNGAFGIALQSGGNGLQPKPVVNLATSGGSSTTLQFSTSGLAAGTVLEFFKSLAGDPSTNNDQAHVLLGSYTIQAGDPSIKSVTFPTGTPVDQFVVATDTTTANNTSTFSTRTQVFNPFQVTTTDDNGDNTSPTAGSLRAAIINTNNNPGTDTITFAIPGSGPHTLTLVSALPTITDKVVIDATSQLGYNGSPLIRLDGNNALGFGLVLATNSDGSTIEGLNIVRFASAGIQVQSGGSFILGNFIGTDFNGTNPNPSLGNAIGVSISGANNVIGGTSGFSANRIAFNTGAAVVVDGAAAVGNAIRGNLIFSNASPQIKLANNGNLNQPVPGLTAASSSAGKTFVSGTLSGFATSTTFTLDFFANDDKSLTGSQARIYLGSFDVTTDGSGAASFTAPLAASVSPGVTVTATATSPSANTSELSSPPVIVANPFVVTTTADNGSNASPTVGSLRAAIVAANNNPGPDTIAFQLPDSEKTNGTWTIAIASPMASITDPVTIDGSSQFAFANIVPPSTTAVSPLVILSGSGSASTSPGLDLTSSAGGSTFSGLKITGFKDGIAIASSGNLIGGTLPGTGNILSGNSGFGVSVSAGVNNAIRGNLIFGDTQGLINNPNDPQTPPQPPPTAPRPPAPQTMIYTSVPGLTTIDGSITGGPKGAYVLEFFASAPNGSGASTFLGTWPVNVGADNGSAPFTASFQLQVTAAQQLIATVTSPVNDTSVFSVAASFKDPFTVYKSSDNVVGDQVGTLRLAITNANLSPGKDTISFSTSSGPLAISLSQALPAITDSVKIDASSNVGSQNTPLVTLDGTSAGDGANGLLLAPGSGGSEILGLGISNFKGNGILIQSSNNTIGNATAGAGNTIGPNGMGSPSGTAGVNVASGNQNLITGNTYVGTNGGNSPVQANDIVLSPVANDGRPAPIVTGATFNTGDTQLFVSVIVPVANPGDQPKDINASFDVYYIDTAAQQTRRFLGTFTPNGTVKEGDIIDISVNATDAVSNNNIVVTERVGNDTSPFSIQEVAAVASNLVVNTLSKGSGSLAYALQHYSAKQKEIFFAFDPSPTTSQQVYTINVDPANPLIAKAKVIIDGTTWHDPLDPTNTGKTRPIGGVQIVAGSNIGAVNGLTLAFDSTQNFDSSGSSITGLAIYGFTGGAGIEVDSGTNTISGSTLGLNFAGDIIQGNRDGIWINNAKDNVLGGDITAAGQANLLVSGNTGSGIRVSGVNATGNRINGAFVGTDRSGSVGGTTLRNGIGILFDLDTSANSVGLKTAQPNPETLPSGGLLSYLGRNVIGGNGVGIQIGNPLTGSSSSATGISVAGNLIGTDVTGTTAIGNGAGVAIYGSSSNNTIGGTSTGTTSGYLVGTDEVLNYVVGNSGDGIRIEAGPGNPNDLVAQNLVAQNLISRNVGNGIHVKGVGDTTTSTGVAQIPTIIRNNFIGTDITGTKAYDYVGGSLTSLGNILSGVLLETAANGTIDPKIGTARANGLSATVSTNLISGNGLSGVTVASAQPGTAYLTNVSITKNIIGLDVSGASAVSYDPTTQSVLPLGNVLDGVLIDNVLNVKVGVPAVGGNPTRDWQNVISGNLGRGVEIRGDILSGKTVSGSNSVRGNFIGIDANGTKVAAPPAKQLTLGNYNLGNLGDGIFLFVPQATTIASNLVSGNRAAGIHPSTQQTDSGGNPGSTITGTLTIQSNFIGTDVYGMSVTQGTDGSISLGNGSDGIFLDSIQRGVKDITKSKVTITANLISGNRANGIDLLDSNAVVVLGNLIGTNAGGTGNLVNGSLTGLGNSSSGIFLNGASYNSIGGTFALSNEGSIDWTRFSGNLISGNSGSGILISVHSGSGNSTQASNSTSTGNTMSGNVIGLDSTLKQQLSNQVAGVVISGAAGNTVGSTASAGGDTFSGNVIAGNRLYGVQVADAPDVNVIGGNWIGTNPKNATQLGNSADGVFILNSLNTKVGVPGAGNTIGGNQGNGVQIFGKGSGGNLVVANLIGLGSDGWTPIANQGNGVYLNNAGQWLDSGGVKHGSANSVVGNVISGNAQSGVLLQGGSDGSGNIPGTGNILGTGNKVQGNFIGTKWDGLTPVRNGGYGILVYGSQSNTIGVGFGEGSVTLSALSLGGKGNLISGNGQSGITIFSPADSAIAISNTVAGNLIGTNRFGTDAIPNNGNGVEILSGRGEMIGLSGASNLISGNRNSGIFVTEITTLPNISDAVLSHPAIISGNYVGTDITGVNPLRGTAQQFGIAINNSTLNVIGSSSTSLLSNTNVPSMPSNLISGNALAGIVLSGSSSSNLIRGSYIGVGADGRSYAGLGSPIGVFVNRAGGNVIGSSETGGGNLITQSSSATSGTGPVFGIEILGPPVQGAAGNLVQGNLIGLDVDAKPAILLDPAVPSRRVVGVSIQNFPGNVVGVYQGSADVNSRNIISGNGTAGVEITGTQALSNVVNGNFIGSDPSGTMMILPWGPAPSDAIGAYYSQFARGTQTVPPTQNVGVLINQASFNIVGGGALGTGNLLSGNLIGVDIEGAAGDPTKGASNLVQGNLIGTDRYGKQAVPNLVYGVEISGSPRNFVSSNLISANGVAGVFIFSGAPRNSTATNLGNTIVSNMIGTSILGHPAFPANVEDMAAHPDIINPSTDVTDLDKTHFLPSYLGYQLHGIAIIGSSNNVIGVGDQGNVLSGNILTGIYLTSHDFLGATYAAPFGNPIVGNQITANGMYGVFRFDAPAASNPVRLNVPGGNTVTGNPQAIGDFTSGFTTQATIQPNPHPIYLPSTPINFDQPFNAFVPQSTPRQPVPPPVRPLRRSRTGSTRLASASPPQASTSVRPRVPALTSVGARHVPVMHPVIKKG